MLLLLFIEKTVITSIIKVKMRDEKIKKLIFFNEDIAIKKFMKLREARLKK